MSVEAAAVTAARHWPAGQFGNLIGTIQCIVIHETSGTPTYAGVNTFINRYTCAVPTDQAIGSQYFVESNGTAYTLIGNRHLAGAVRLTGHAGWHDEGIDMNPYSVGIENADIGDSGITPGHGTGPHWWSLSDSTTDVDGMKVYMVLEPNNSEDAALIWIARFAQEWFVVPATPTKDAHWSLRAGVAPGFSGAGDIADGANPATDRHVNRPPAWKNMIFTERNMRSLVLLTRLLAEDNGLPRNFPLLPYASAASNDWQNAQIFRKLILAEERGDDIAHQMGTTRADIEANSAAFRTWYQGRFREAWSRFFGAIPGGAPVTPCFRGILSHAINGGHPCPGPLFDWYRFAREVWDWWWYPFDLEATGPATTMRPYLQARLNTPLLEYYFDAHGTAADYDARRSDALLPESYLVPEATPLYALANGVIVAARLGTDGLLLVRHEVFHQGTNGQIDYGTMPTYVWSLVRSLSNATASIPSLPPAVPSPDAINNPSWLDRFIMRLRECELAAGFYNANTTATATNAALRAALLRAWGRAPTGGARRPTGQEIERDAAAYRTFANNLMAGNVVLFPLEGNTDATPVRVCLGDVIGFPSATAPQHVQIEIFSRTELPVPGRVQGPVSVAGDHWWVDATATNRREAVNEADLPAKEMVWQYSLTSFLGWVNGVTWASEWQKYGAAGTAPTRPITRIVP